MFPVIYIPTDNWNSISKDTKYWKHKFDSLKKKKKKKQENNTIKEAVSLPIKLTTYDSFFKFSLVPIQVIKTQ